MRLLLRSRLWLLLSFLGSAFDFRYLTLNNFNALCKSLSVFIVCTKRLAGLTLKFLGHSHKLLEISDIALYSGYASLTVCLYTLFGEGEHVLTRLKELIFIRLILILLENHC